MNDTNTTNIINIINTDSDYNYSLILTFIFVSPCIFYILCCLCYICLRLDIRIRINNNNNNNLILNKINIELLNKTTKLFNITKLEELQIIKECTICIDNYKIGNNVRQLKCLHTFHQECIDKWLVHNNMCPNCRQITNVMK
jgi:hypothetical protein